MTHSNFTEDASSVLDLARNSGFEISQAQLKRWHGNGLLPPPIQKRAPYGKGSIILYPTGTGSQLVALCTRQQAYERARKRWKIQNLLWEMWFDGFEIEEKYIRPLLEREARCIDKVFAEIKSKSSADDRYVLPLQIRDELSNQLEKTRSRPILRQVQKRTGKNNLPKFVDALISMVFGKYNIQNSARDEKMIVDGLGLGRAKKDWISRVGTTINGEVTPDISDALKLLGDNKFADFFANLNWPDAKIIRDELRELFKVFSEFSELMVPIFGKYAFGIGTAHTILSNLDLHTRIQFFLAWGILQKQNTYKNGIQNILKSVNISELITAQKAPELFKLIREEFPEWREQFSNKKIKKALSSRRIMKELLNDISALKDKYPNKMSEITSKLGLHP